MLKVLVLDAFSRSAVETIQSLGRHGVEVQAASPRDCLAFRSRRLHRRWRQPPTEDVSAFLEWLRELDRENSYSLIVPSTEFSLLALSHISSQDPLRKKANIPDQDALEVALDKWATLSLANSCGISVPATRLLESTPLTVPESFPVVLKSRRSLARISDKVYRMESVLVRDADQWEQTLQILLPQTSVLEQYRLVGRGVGIEMLYRHGERVWYFSHERLHEGSRSDGVGGASCYRRSLSPPPELLASCTTLLNHLNWNGVAMLEFLRTADGTYWLMEINPRLWGSVGLAIDAGVDFPWALLLSANGQNIPPQPKYRIPYYTRALEEDVRWLVARLRSNPWTGIVELAKLGRPLLGLESWDYFDWGDSCVTFVALSQLTGQIVSGLRNKVRARLLWRRMKRIHQRNLARMASRGKSIRKLLILCYGNICRSPFAEVIARRELRDFDISSAGFHPLSGRASPDHLQLTARSMGIDLSDHKSRRISSEEVKAADIILLMDSANLVEFRKQFPADLEKVLFLGMFLSPGREIRDPYDASVEQTSRILGQIARAMHQLSCWLGVRGSQGM